MNTSPHSPKKKAYMMWLVLSVSLLLSCLIWLILFQYIHHDAEERFRQEAEFSLKKIQHAIAQYDYAAMASMPLFSDASSTYHQWRKLYPQTKLAENFPGIQELGFVWLIDAAQRQSLEAQLKHDISLDFQIHPPGARSQYGVVIASESTLKNTPSRLGYDMLSNQTFAQAMNQARDTGKMTLSAPVHSAPNTTQSPPADFLMFHPIYQAHALTDTVEGRRQAIAGYTYIPFQAALLMHSVLGDQVDHISFELYDDTRAPHHTLLYRSPKAQENPHAAKFTLDKSFYVGGRVWRGHFFSTAQFAFGANTYTPVLVGLAGIFCNLLLLLTFSLYRKNHALREGQSQFFEKIFNHAPLAILMANEDGAIVSVNKLFERMFGYPSREIVGRKVEILLPVALHHQHEHLRHQYLQNPTNRAMGSGRELYGVAKDGHHIAIEVGLSQIQQGNHHYVLAVIIDISTRKQLEQERAAMDEKIREMAYHDALTGLPNRRQLMEGLSLALAQARLHQTYGGLLFIDLDKFKALNDTLGHDAGDQLLIQVACRLRECVREVDTVARLGGDEFIALFPALTSDKSTSQGLLEKLSRRILCALNQPYTLNDAPYHITPSIGATVFTGDDDADSIFRQADDLMYEAKHAGKNTLRLD